MTTYTLEKVIESDVEMTEKVQEVTTMFGLAIGRRDRETTAENCQIDVGTGQIVFITGSSGSGKTTALQTLKEKIARDRNVLDLDDLAPLPALPVVDCFESLPLRQSLQWLSMAGLSDAHALIRRPGQLSVGEYFRFQLARALARRPEVLVIDEFCSTLDRITAALVARNIRKMADRYNITFIVATAHDDIMDDLRPDTVMIKYGGGWCDVYGTSGDE